MMIRHVIKLPEVDSTNNYLKRLTSDLKSGSLVVAKQQTQGKGRYGNRWLSELGNLYFSVLIKDVEREDMFCFLMRTAVSIIRLFSGVGIEAMIKYPNDIVVDKKKIAGILMESSGFERLENLIIGIGININQMDFGELNGKAISMRLLTSKQYDLDTLLKTWIEIFNEHNHPQQIYDDYLAKSIILGQTVTYLKQPWVVKKIAPNGAIELYRSGQTCFATFDQMSWQAFYEN